MDKIVNIAQNLTQLIDAILLMTAKGTLSPKSSLSKIAVFAKEELSKNSKNSLRIDDTILLEETTPATGRKTGMLEHSLRVASLILNSGIGFREACKIVSHEKNVSLPSILQGCCRAQGLAAYNWHKLSSTDPESKINIAQKLIYRYPHEKKKIFDTFKINI